MTISQLPLRAVQAREDFQLPAGLAGQAWPYNLASTRAALVGLFMWAEGMLAHLEYMASLKSEQATDILRLSHGQGTQRLLEDSVRDYGLSGAPLAG